MGPRLVLTVSGTGDDGRQYIIRGYKKRQKANDGQMVEEAGVSIVQTSDGVELWCTREVPLEFLMPSTGVRIRAEKIIGLNEQTAA
jgi:hypothetical protein